MKKNNFSGFIGCLVDGFRVLFGFKSKIDLYSDIVVGGSGTSPTPGPPRINVKVELSVSSDDYNKLQKKDNTGGFLIIPLNTEVYEIMIHSEISKSSIFYHQKQIELSVK